MSDLLAPVVLGIHLLSAHVPAHPGQNDYNFGVYVEIPTESPQQRDVAGVYRNTLDRASIYVGREIEFGPWSIELVAMYGYQKKLVDCPQAPGCYHYTGFTRGAIAPAAALSYHFNTPVYGLRPVVTVMPGINKSSSVFHLSIERTL